jgi:putative transposase
LWHAAKLVGVSPNVMTAAHYRAEMTIRFAIWDQATGAAGQPAEA